MKLYDFGATAIIIFVLGMIFGGAVEKDTHFIEKTINNESK